MSRNSTKVVALPTASVPVGEAGVQPEAGDSFVSSPYVAQVTKRALAYLQAGYPVHFSGVAGTGKTTLAFHVASKLGRPVTLVHGDDEFCSSDLVGREGGYRKHKIVDNFIHSVLKTEEESRNLWVDDRLTTACKNGEIFIYDEFNLTEIAWRMHYSSVAHLSNQFKKVTGLTPSHFKQMKDKRRSPIEDIGSKE